MHYFYRGYDKEANLERGYIEADTADLAIRQLREERGLVAITTLKRSPMRKTVLKAQEVAGRLNPKRLLPQRAVAVLTQPVNLPGIATQTAPAEDFSQLLAAGAEVVIAAPPTPTAPLPAIQFKKKKAENKGVSIKWQDIKVRPASRKKYRIKYSEIRDFTQRLSMLLSSGVMLSNALSILADGATNRDMKHVITTLLDRIETKGYLLSQAMTEFPDQFNEFFIAMVAVGEETGTLDKCLLDVLAFIDRRNKIAAKMRNAMIYPAIILGIIVLLMIGASIFFIPMFKELFNDLGLELPPITKTLFFVSDHIIPFIIGILGLIFILKLVSKHPTVSKSIKIAKDKLLISTPGIKNFFLGFYMFCFSNTLMIALRNGIRMMDGLILSQKTIDNVFIQAEINEMLGLVAEGYNISEAVKQQQFFDPSFHGVLYTGEESGRMAHALAESTKFYDARVDNAVNVVSEWIQPASILLIALVVLPIVLGIFLPLLDVSSGAGIS